MKWNICKYFNVLMDMIPLESVKYDGNNHAHEDKLQWRVI
ncbi:hypothetical protein SAMN05421578_11668 [Paenibacillus macquariensis]|uniref:Uncharacterized protein n=1 Tax=Paenibacillus macquariensis TaxID=948756 RepID=A0ABY1KAC2_9BACL|nr:hypothetical protein SAMN05421578_11668 [Paenibacillus macquariensis]